MPCKEFITVPAQKNKETGTSKPQTSELKNSDHITAVFCWESLSFHAYRCHFDTFHSQWCSMSLQDFSFEICYNLMHSVLKAHKTKLLAFQSRCWKGERTFVTHNQPWVFPFLNIVWQKAGTRSHQGACSNKDLSDGCIFSQSLVKYVLQGKKRQWPVQHASLPYWKLPVMLDTLVWYCTATSLWSTPLYLKQLWWLTSCFWHSEKRITQLDVRCCPFSVQRIWGQECICWAWLVHYWLGHCASCRLFSPPHQTHRQTFLSVLMTCWQASFSPPSCASCSLKLHQQAVSVGPVSCTYNMQGCVMVDTFVHTALHPSHLALFLRVSAHRVISRLGSVKPRRAQVQDWPSG